MEDLQSSSAQPEILTNSTETRAGRLWSVEDIAKLDQELPILKNTVAWIRDYLARPHPQLGRTGVVCPFVPRALSLNQIYLAVIYSRDATEKDTEKIILKYQEEFFKLKSNNKEDDTFKAIITIFPGVAPHFIESIQSRMKVQFVQVGLMLGEFHEYNNSPGLHNLDYRPLRSPMPMLAIRRIVESDLVFLMRSTDPVELRIQFLSSYLRVLGTTLSEAKAETARAALAQAEAEAQSR